MRTTTLLSLILLSLIAFRCSAPRKSPASRPTAGIPPPLYQLPQNNQTVPSAGSSTIPLPTSQVSSAPQPPLAQHGWSGRREAYEEGDFILNDVPLEAALTALVVQTERRWSLIRQIHVDWDVLATAGVAREARVSARLWSPKVSKALQAILDSASRGTKADLTFFDEGDSCIRVTTRAHHLAKDGVVREYSMHRFLIDLADGPAAVAVSSAPPAGRAITPPERMVAITGLIKETVDPNSWKKTDACSIGIANEILVIRQLEDNHREIQRLLDQLNETRSHDVLNLRVRPTTEPATTRPAR